MPDALNVPLVQLGFACISCSCQALHLSLGVLKVVAPGLLSILHLCKGCLEGDALEIFEPIDTVKRHDREVEVAPTDQSRRSWVGDWLDQETLAKPCPSVVRGVAGGVDHLPGVKLGRLFGLGFWGGQQVEDSRHNQNQKSG